MVYIWGGISALMTLILAKLLVRKPNLYVDQIDLYISFKDLRTNGRVINQYLGGYGVNACMIRCNSLDDRFKTIQINCLTQRR